MNVLIWTLVAFLVGAIPFAVVMGRIWAGTDIRRIGDGNPGSANTWKAAGSRVGLAAIVIEILKGAVPVATAIAVEDFAGWSLVVVAIAPVLGHACSPFLGFRGGKAIAATGGIWAATTPWGLGLLFGCLCMGMIHILQLSHAWTAVAGFGLFGIILVLWLGQSHLIALWAANLAVLAAMHRKELRTKAIPRPWIRQVLRLPR